MGAVTKKGTAKKAALPKLEFTRLRFVSNAAYRSRDCGIWESVDGAYRILFRRRAYGVDVEKRRRYMALVKGPLCVVKLGQAATFAGAVRHCRQNAARGISKGT